FAVYATVGGPDFGPGDINPQTVFVSISLFALLNRPIGMLSHIISQTIGVTVATRRIQKFLLAEEITESLDDNDQNLPTDPNEPLIVIKDGTFAWGQESFENDSQKLDNGSEIKEKEEEI